MIRLLRQTSAWRPELLGGCLCITGTIVIIFWLVGFALGHGSGEGLVLVVFAGVQLSVI